VNNEERKPKDGKIWVNINESWNDNPSELQPTVKELRSELKSIREDHECILKAYEELNNIFLAKIHSDEREKHKEPELNMPKTTLQTQGKKLEFLVIELKLLVRNQPNTTQKNIRI